MFSFYLYSVRALRLSVALLKPSYYYYYVIKQITGHARESSMDDYYEVDSEQRTHIVKVLDRVDVDAIAATRSVVDVGIQMQVDIEDRVIE
jgi:ferritin-like protein